MSGGLNLYCQDHIQNAVEDSWNEYFMDVSSPDKVTSIKKTLFIPGFNVGVNVNIPFSGTLKFKTGLHFNIKGGKAEGKYGTGGPETSFSNQWTYGYLSLPLVVQYWIKDNFFLEIGPEVGFLLTAKEKESEEGYPDYESTDKSYYKKVEINMSVGGGYVFGSSGVGVFARFIQGLTKVYTGESYYSNVRNAVGQFGIFYIINTKK